MEPSTKSDWQIANERARAEMKRNEEILREYRATHKPTPSEQGRLNIQITARRWFDKKWGNTYHSVSVRVDLEEGELYSARNPFEYGYGDGYLQTAFALLQEGGIFPKTGRRLNGFDTDYSEFLDAMREKKHNFYVSVSDVSRKKDL